MIDKLKPKSEFNKNVITLMTGTTIAQAIPIAISPILTRLYTPQDFGVFAFFLAITAIFGSIANARYELAIMLPKKDEDAINIFALGFIISTIISFLILVLVVLFNEYFVKLLGNKEIGIWFYFLPITVFLSGLWNNLSYFNNRKKQYKDLAKATIIKSIVIAIVQLSIGFIKGGAAGLISGQIVSQFFANTKLLSNIVKNKFLVSRISIAKIREAAKRYINFPKFSIWAVLANTLSHNMTSILISAFYSITTLGFYSLVQRLLGIPSAIIAQSIGQVFFQQGMEEKRKTGTAIKTFNKTIKKLIIIGVPSFGVLFFIAEDLFAFIFGEEWRITGIYAQIVIPLFFIRFICSPVSLIVAIFENQKIGLCTNLILLLSATGLLLYSSFNSFEFDKFLYLFSTVLSLEYLSFLIYYKKLSSGFNRKK
jgi:O-antigen/teichoic acid export membrane protein